MTSVPPLDVDKHVAYILGLEEKTKTSDALYFTDHKRLSGVYWAATSLALVGRLDELPRDRIISYVMQCYRADEGAFAGNVDQDAHLLYTVSGLQILALYDALHLIDASHVATSIAALQCADGSFAGDMWGEVDTRFSYCALLALCLLNRMDVVDLAAATRFVCSCQNFDGGFGCVPDAESHAGQVFCCVGALALSPCGLESLDEAARDRLALWLCERQLPCGGFNGRPDKREDVCYSWWVLASLHMLGVPDFIDGNALAGFIANCQDEDGGIADRPDDLPDVFHTFFGVAALSLLGNDKVQAMDAALALPKVVVARLEERR